jgi:hypothetical protein
VTSLDWIQIFNYQLLSCYAIYRMESILRHPGHINPKSYMPRTRQIGRNKGWLVIVPLVHWTPISIFDYWLISYLNLPIWRCHSGLISMTSHLMRNWPLENEWIVICSVTRNKDSFW